MLPPLFSPTHRYYKGYDVQVLVPAATLELPQPNGLMVVGPVVVYRDADMRAWAVSQVDFEARVMIREDGADKVVRRFAPMVGE